MSVLKRFNGTSWEPIGPAVINSSNDLFENIIAPEFSPFIPYGEGDYVIYDGLLYKCKKSYSALTDLPIHYTPSIDREHWEQTTVGRELSLEGGSNGQELYEILFSGIDLNDTTERWRMDGIICNRTAAQIKAAYDRGAKFIVKILPRQAYPNISSYVLPSINSNADGIVSITARLINYQWRGPNGEIGYVEYFFHVLDKTVDGSYINLTDAGSPLIPTNGEVNSNGQIIFKNSNATSLFTVQLPLYTGAVTTNN